MVFFVCSSCGESLKKNQVEKHWQTRCRHTQRVSCMDCSKEFWGQDYALHTKCITEDEKYGGSQYVAKEAKGERKQEAWVQRVKEAVSGTQGMNTQLKELLNHIVTFSNIPRKKDKFKKFCWNSLRVRTPALVDQAWEVFHAANAKKEVLGATETPAKEGKEEKENRIEEDKAVVKEEDNNNVKKEKKRKKKDTEEQEDGIKKKKRDTEEQEDGIKEKEIEQNRIKKEIEQDDGIKEKEIEQEDGIKKKKKKKKRAPEENGTTNEEREMEEPEDGIKEKEIEQKNGIKKKKKKKRDIEENGTTNEKGDMEEQEDGIKKKEIEQDDEIEQEDGIKKKKKKKRALEENGTTNEKRDTEEQEDGIKEQEVEQEDGIKKNKKKKKKNVPQEENGVQENGAAEEKEEDTSFKWKAAIKQALGDAPEGGIRMKKLNKKVLSLYRASKINSAHSKSDQEVNDLVNKKVTQGKLFVICNNRVTLRS